VICASCLKKLTRAEGARRWRLAGLVRLAQASFGILTIWLFFYVSGRAMLSIETYFHDNTLWKADSPDD